MRVRAGVGVGIGIRLGKPRGRHPWRPTLFPPRLPPLRPSSGVLAKGMPFTRRVGSPQSPTSIANRGGTLVITCDAWEHGQHETQTPVAVCRWHYMGHQGECMVDQAHRGFSQATDEKGYGSVNPMFWKTTPSQGRFKGQRCYGYISLEAPPRRPTRKLRLTPSPNLPLEEFVDAATRIRQGDAVAADFDHTLATMHTTIPVTAILEAGARSLQTGGKAVVLKYADDSSCEAVGMA